MFPTGAQRLFNTNDLPAGFDIREIDFTGVGGGYHLSGNAIVLDAGVQDGATGLSVLRT